MGPCLGTVGRPGGNSKSVVLVSPDDASSSTVSGERARLLLLLLPGGRGGKGETSSGARGPKLRQFTRYSRKPITT